MRAAVKTAARTTAAKAEAMELDMKAGGTMAAMEAVGKRSMIRGTMCLFWRAASGGQPDMELTQILNLMGTLKFYGMRSAYDEVMGAGIAKPPITR
ncbi:MAG: transposase [Cereibacter sp.]|jgi:hypothetical protein|nr:transposase [Cereibacter sp.]